MSLSDFDDEKDEDERIRGFCDLWPLRVTMENCWMLFAWIFFDFYATYMFDIELQLHFHLYPVHEKNWR